MEEKKNILIIFFKKDFLIKEILKQYVFCVKNIKKNDIQSDTKNLIINDRFIEIIIIYFLSIKKTN